MLTEAVAQPDAPGELGRFFELSEDLLCVAGFDGRFRQLSPSWSTLLGFSIEELTAVPFEAFVHPDDRVRTSRQFAEQVAQGVRAVHFANRYRHKNGSYRSLRWNAIPDAERGLVYAVARWVDPQIESEGAIRDSEERFRSAFDDALVGMCLTSPSGDFLRVNSAGAAMLGRSADELVGMHFSDVTHPDDVGRNSANMQQALSGETSGFHDEKRYLRPDGAQITVMLASTLVRDTDGEPLHFVTALLDVSEERAATARSAATAVMLDAIVHNSQSLIYVKDLDGTYLLANTSFQDAFAVAEEDILGRDDTWLDPDLEPVWRANDLLAREGAYRLQEWSGSGAAKRWYQSVKFPLRDGAGKLYATCGVSLDVTELHRQREEADRAGAFSAAVLAASPDAIVVDDLADGRRLYASPTAASLIGISSDEERDPIVSSAHLEDRPRLLDALAAAGELADGQVLHVQYRAKVPDRDGAQRWLSRRITPFHRHDDGRLMQILSVVRDVSEMVAAENRLTHAALHDSLTKLPNRRLLNDRLNGALLRARRHHQEVAVLFCDLDNFKRVNDGAGHAVGDAILLEAGRRLRDCLRTLDTVARVGGDEFVIIVEPLAHDSGAGPRPTVRQLGESVARRVVAAIREPVVVNGIAHPVTASVGLAFAGGDGDAAPTAETALRDADAAMYRAKASGRDRYEICDQGMQVQLTERARVERLLRATVAPMGAATVGNRSETGVLDVAYQPIYAADTGCLQGFEALARLSDPHGTLVPADVFISVAEEVGLIGALGDQVLRKACRSLARWRSNLHCVDLTMAVNLSARQAQHPSLAEDVLAVLAQEDIPPDRLVLELTESILMDAGPATLRAFNTLRTEGVGIHIDDFGTGYASLRYLAEFPVTALKVDRSFTAGLPDDPTSTTIVRAVAGLARDLDLGCIVEGIETAEQRAAVPPSVSLQGYLLGRPGSAAAAEQTIRDACDYVPAAAG